MIFYFWKNSGLQYCGPLFVMAFGLDGSNNVRSDTSVFVFSHQFIEIFVRIIIQFWCFHCYSLILNRLHVKIHRNNGWWRRFDVSVYIALTTEVCHFSTVLASSLSWFLNNLLTPLTLAFASHCYHQHHNRIVVVIRCVVSMHAQCATFGHGTLSPNALSLSLALFRVCGQKTIIIIIFDTSCSVFCIRCIACWLILSCSVCGDDHVATPWPTLYKFRTIHYNKDNKSSSSGSGSSNDNLMAFYIFRWLIVHLVKFLDLMNCLKGFVSIHTHTYTHWHSLTLIIHSK